jgi:hypothetical protein
MWKNVEILRSIGEEAAEPGMPNWMQFPADTLPVWQANRHFDDR